MLVEELTVHVHALGVVRRRQRTPKGHHQQPALGLARKPGLFLLIVHELGLDRQQRLGRVLPDALRLGVRPQVGGSAGGRVVLLQPRQGVAQVR